MPAAGLLAVLDDIATVLDDVAVLAKVASKKTAGVLGDDLALNAQQVTGVRAARELPVVWGVAKGSLLNKVILVPGALAISWLAPMLVTPLLMVGGAFLCFEGVEKLLHKALHSEAEQQAEHDQLLAAVADTSVSLEALERDKIKGAVRTDFILSAEIVAIALGSVQQAPFSTRVLVLSVVSVGVTIGVYGLVAAIVKLDDLGLYLAERGKSAGASGALQRAIGIGLLKAAPWLMKFLSVAGTLAMFLVGGGILTHGVPGLHDWVHHQTSELEAPALLGQALPVALDLVVGLVVGAVVLGAVTGARKALSPRST